MRTRKALYPQTRNMYKCELETCGFCGERLQQSATVSGRKIVQTLTTTMQIGYYGKKCPHPECTGHEQWLRSAAWQHLAPLHGTYGYDVIARIGWQRQTGHRTFAEVHSELAQSVHISEAQVRYLYTYQYLPLLACHEREAWAEITRVSNAQGLLLTLDGLAPEGGEPQLWLVRELRTGKTLRSGWLSEQGQTAFENFLRPIVEAGWRVEAVMSDKQRGLMPALQSMFPAAKRAFCHSHYLRNIAEPVASAAESMKVGVRKHVRQAIGQLIRPEQVAQPGVLMVTGVLPTPIAIDAAGTVPPQPGPDALRGAVGQEPAELPDKESTQVAPAQAEIESALKRRIRYLLTLKGRPPFRLAGIEMYERLREVVDNLAEMVTHHPSPCLAQLQQGLEAALTAFQDDYHDVRQGADWLQHIATVLDPADKPARTSTQVHTALLRYLDEMHPHRQTNPVLTAFAQHIDKTTHNYLPGLFHTYDIPDLPRTNNDRESEFRALNQHLLRTTGQKGATRRLLQRSGAWELIPRPNSLAETTVAIATVAHSEYQQERARVQLHRERFRFHTRSGKRARTQLQDLKARWLQLPPGDLPETIPLQSESISV